MKLTLTILAGLFALLLIGVIALPFIVDIDKHKDTIIRQAEDATGYDITVDGQIKMGVLPLPHVTLKGVSVQAPRMDEPFFTAGAASVAIDVFKLLGGTVAISSVDLDTPVFIHETDTDGKPLWLNERIEDNAEADSESGKKAKNITFESIKITNGRAEVRRAGEEPLIVSDLNTKLSIDSFAGPFEAKGDLNAMNRAISFDIEAGKLDKESNSLPVSGNISLKNEKLSLKVAGIANMGDTQGYQGEVTLRADDLSLLQAEETRNPQLALPFEISGLLTASKSSAVLNDMKALLGQKQFTGSAQASGYQEGGTLAGALKLQSPGVLSLDMSVSGTAPSNFKLDLSTPDIEQALNILPIKIELPEAAAQAKSVTAKVSGSYAANKIVLAEGSTITLNDTPVSLGMTYTVGAKGARPDVNLKLSAARLNADEWMPKKDEVKTKSEKESALEGTVNTVKNVSLPVDLTLDARIGTFIHDGKTYDDVKVQGSLIGSNLKLSNASVGNIYQTSLTASGEIADLSSLAGVDVRVKADSKNIPALLNGFDVKIKDLPDTLNSGALDSTLKGNAERVVFDATANALNGRAKISGTAVTLLSKPVYDNITFDIKHPNLYTLLKAFNPSLQSSPALNKPVDLYAALDRGTGVYSFKELKGSLGPTTLAGDLVLDMSTGIAGLKGNLMMGDIPLAEFLGGGGSGGASTSSNNGTQVRWSRQAINTDWMRRFNADLDIKAKSLSKDKWLITNPSFSFDLKDGVMTVSDLTGGLFNGTIKGGVTVKSSADANAPLSIDGNAALSSVSMEQFVRAFTGSPLIQSNGVMNFDTSLKATGLSPAALIFDLNGKGSADATDVTLRGIDVAELGRSLNDLDDAAENLFKSSIRGGQSHFETMKAEFTVTEGVATFTTLLLDGDSADILAEGSKINLPAWTMDVNGKIVLAEPADAPPIEFSFRGPLNNPAKIIAQNAVQNYLQKKLGSKVNKLIENKIGGNLGEKLGIGGEAGSQLDKAIGLPIFGGGRTQQPEAQAQQPDNAQETAVPPAPAVEDEPAAAPQEPANDNDPPSAEDAINGLINGLIR